MVLDDLVTVIETLQQRIRDHGSSLRENETRTRAVLIDPLLTVLGWDVADPALVTLEYSVGSGRADYALRGQESIPAAIVEAKRLAHTLSDDERMQMLNYANIRGVRYASVTDGNVWELYEVFKQGPLEDRRILSLRIAEDPRHELALHLLRLWRSNLASGRPIPAQEPLFHEETVAEPDDPVEVAQDVPPAPDPSPPPQPGWVQLSDFDPPSGTKPPSAIRFSDGVEKNTLYWNDIVTEVASWLYTTNRLNSENIPVASSSEGYIVNYQPVHPTGREFISHRKIAAGRLAINTNISATTARNNAKILLEHCKVSPAEVFVLPAD